MDDRRHLHIGTAGWALPKAVREHFPGEGSHLARYARVFPASEINSTFHRSHREATYARWSASVPADFRFSVKVPKAITHERRLEAVEGLLDAFLTEVAPLGAHLGCLLIQLPPSFAFGPSVAPFLARVRASFAGPVAIEPRHPSWFEPAIGRLLERYRCGRVAADPPRVAAAGGPGGWPGLAYWRLHGSPRMYYSSYPRERLEALAKALRRDGERGAQVWCIFDNTASGAAAANALELLAQLT